MIWYTEIFEKKALYLRVTKRKTSVPERYAQWFADSEMQRFPEVAVGSWESSVFGYAQGVGCCAMLQMWKSTGDKRYFDYVENGQIC